jgi:hypothetical protein
MPIKEHDSVPWLEATAGVVQLAERPGRPID